MTQIDKAQAAYEARVKARNHKNKVAIRLESQESKRGRLMETIGDIVLKTARSYKKLKDWRYRNGKV